MVGDCKTMGCCLWFFPARSGCDCTTYFVYSWFMFLQPDVEFPACFNHVAQYSSFREMVNWRVGRKTGDILRIQDTLFLDDHLL